MINHMGMDLTIDPFLMNLRHPICNLWNKSVWPHTALDPSCTKKILLNFRMSKLFVVLATWVFFHYAFGMFYTEM